MKKFFNFLVIIIFSLQLILLVWGINKGFDLTDEGYIALLLKQERPSFGQLRTFEILLGRWLNRLDLDVLGFRVIAIGLTVLSSLVFFISFQKYIDEYLPDRERKISPVAGFSLIAFLNFYQFARSTSIINYNIITNINVVLATSFMFFSLSGSTAISKKNGWLFQPWIAAIGFLMGIQFTAKQPVVIAFLFFLFLFVYLQGEKKSLRFFFVMAVYIAIGYILSNLLVSRTLRSTPHSLQSETIFNYFQIILLEYGQDILGLLSFLLFALPALIFGSALLFIWLKEDLGRFTKFRLTALITLAVFFLASVGFLFFIKNLTPLSNSTGKNVGILFFTFSLLNIGIWMLNTCGFSKISFTKTFQRGHSKRDFLLLAFLLLFLPFIAAVGTGNSIFKQSARHILPWGALLILVYNLLLNERKLFGYASVTLVLAAIWLGVQFFYNYLFQPYRLVGNMFDQTHQFSQYVPRGKGILVSWDTKQTVDEISKSLYTKTDFQEGDPVLDLYVMPGITYLVGGRSPTGGWTNQTFRDRICGQLIRSDFQVERMVILRNTDIVKDIKDCMLSVGIDMDNDFISIMSTPYANQRNAEFDRIELVVNKNLMK